MDEIGQLPVLEGEIFDSVKPGLSAFVDQPKQVRFFFLIRYLDSQCLDNNTTLKLTFSPKVLRSPKVPVCPFSLKFTILSVQFISAKLWGNIIWPIKVLNTPWETSLFKEDTGLILIKCKIGHCRERLWGGSRKRANGLYPWELSLYETEQEGPVAVGS